jgi:putative tricarboxylic transport membrane protein
VKLRDALSGLLFLIFGVAVVLYARTFPPMPGQSVGPSLFPMLAGIGLAAVGAALVISDLRQGASDFRQGAGPWLQPGEWVAKPGMVLNFGLVVADLIFYALVVNTLGFFIAASVFLTVLFAGFRVTTKWIVPLALIVTFTIHYAFYTLLRVPLPWGLLQEVAW